jgi:hypothetical protein
MRPDTRLGMRAERGKEHHAPYTYGEKSEEVEVRLNEGGMPR